MFQVHLSIKKCEAQNEMQLNPYRSNRPIRDFEFDNNCDTFYSNQFMTVVRKIG